MKVLLGVTGSVAAVLTPRLVDELIRARHEVEIVATERGLFFFNPDDIKVKLWRDKDEWPEDGYHKGDPVEHIELGKRFDVLLIAPLTADTLSDLAHGKADKFLTSIALAWDFRNKPIVIAPAMNTLMWKHPATEHNLALYRMWMVENLTIVGPIEKQLACGDVGMGAMAEIVDIVEAINGLASTGEVTECQS